MMTEKERELHRIYGDLYTKVLKLEKAEKSRKRESDHPAEKLLYEWVKTGAITCGEFKRLIDALAYLWEFQCLPGNFATSRRTDT